MSEPQHQEYDEATNMPPSSIKPKQKSRKKKPYEELKIKDGPLYNLTAPDESVASPGVNNIKAFGSTGSLSSYSEASTATAPTVCSPCLPAESTALLIVDVQPEYWSNCPAVQQDFPEFPRHLEKTIEICRKRKAKIIWVRADYRQDRKSVV